MVQTGAGIVHPASSMTVANGQAETWWFLGWRSLNQTVTASVPNVGSVTFGAYAGINWKNQCPPSGPPPPAIGLSPSSVSFTATRGGANPAPQTVSVTNTGGGTLSGLTVGTISYVRDSSGLTTGWLSATLNGSTAPATLTLNATIGTLAPGAYTATVPLTSSVASNSPKYVAVTFNVQ
jgi:hypothetical protein